MIKLIVFDMDKTLAEEGKSTPDQSVKRIKKIKDSGVDIALCSGKPTNYLSGFLRQFGIEDGIMGGENGCVVQFGTGFPPTYYNEVKPDKKTAAALKRIKQYISEKFPELWFQPNTVAVTCFTEDEKIGKDILSFIEHNEDEFSGVTVYPHWDSFDFIPKGVSKATALDTICKRLNISAENVITVGDGTNDYPMFEYSKYSVGICVPDRKKVTKYVESLPEALSYIEDLINN